MSSVYWTHHHDPRSTTRDEGACALLDRRAGRSRDQAYRLDIYRDTTTLTPAATVSMSRRPGLGAWALLGLIVLGAAALRLRLLDVPLDRDEGEYGYFAQRLLQGVPPYAQDYSLKLLGIYGVYAAILAAFGQSPAAIHLGLLVVNAATTVLVLCLAAHLYNSTVAVSAAAVFAVLSLGPRLYGIAAYAEHFVLLPALAGTLVLLRALESSRPQAFLVSGALFGLAILVKQSGAAFGLFAVVYTLLSGVSPGVGGDWRRRFLPAVAVVAGALAPFALVCAVLAGAGVFDRFWFWTVTYALHYASAVPLTTGVVLFAHKAGELLAASDLVAILLAERVTLWEAPPERVTRELFGLSPFPESVEIARYLRARTAEGERIAVIGSEPEIYFYAGRRGATGYVYMYPLMEDQPYASRMQRQMIDEIEAARPRFVVLVNASASWNVRPQSDRTLFEWWERYAKNFDRVGFVDIVSDRLTTYAWGAEAAGYVPKSLVWVAVFERQSP